MPRKKCSRVSEIKQWGIVHALHVADPTLIQDGTDFPKSLPGVILECQNYE